MPSQGISSCLHKGSPHAFTRDLLMPSQGISSCLHKGSPQALQAVVTLSACHVLQNSPQFIVQGFEICSPRRPILGTDESQ